LLPANTIDSEKAMEFLAQALVPLAASASPILSPDLKRAQMKAARERRAKSSSSTSTPTALAAKTILSPSNEGEKFFYDLIKPDYHASMPPMREGYCDELRRLLVSFGATRDTDRRVVRLLHRQLHMFCVDVLMRPMIYVAWSRWRASVRPANAARRTAAATLLPTRYDDIVNAFANHPSVASRIVEVLFFFCFGATS
jgi:hypothetical protein